MSGKKLLMLVGDHVETTRPWFPSRRYKVVGPTLHAACPGKEAGEPVRTAIHDFEGDRTYSERATEVGPIPTP